MTLCRRLVGTNHSTTDHGREHQERQAVPSAKGRRTGGGGKERGCPCLPVRPSIPAQQQSVETPRAPKKSESDATEGREEAQEIVVSLGKHTRPRERVGLPRNGMRVFFPETTLPGDSSCNACQTQQNVRGSPLRPSEGLGRREGENPGTAACREPEGTHQTATETTVRAGVSEGDSLAARAEEHGESSVDGKISLPPPCQSVSTVLSPEDHSCSGSTAAGHSDLSQGDGREGAPTTAPQSLDTVGGGIDSTSNLPFGDAFDTSSLAPGRNPASSSSASFQIRDSTRGADRSQVNNKNRKKDGIVPECSSIPSWREDSMSSTVNSTGADCRAERVVHGTLRADGQSQGSRVQTSASVDLDTPTVDVAGGGGPGTPSTVRGHLRHIVLEDLVYGFKKPCVLDIKMGKRQRKVGASPEKEKRQLEKSMKTTSHELGFRLCGCQVRAGSCVAEQLGLFLIHRGIPWCPSALQMCRCMAAHGFRTLFSKRRRTIVGVSGVHGSDVLDCFSVPLRRSRSEL